jgi:protein TonB
VDADAAGAPEAVPSPAAQAPSPAEEATDTASRPQAAGPLLRPPVLLDPGPLDYPQAGYRMVVERDGLTARARVEVARGRVVLKVLVRADGTVAAVEVAQSSADPALDGAAAAAAWTWRFRPATRDDTPIAAWALVPVVFE